MCGCLVSLYSDYRYLLSPEGEFSQWVTMRGRIFHATKQRPSDLVPKRLEKLNENLQPSNKQEANGHAELATIKNFIINQ